MTAILTGFTVGFTLILAIGAQNAFVLRQGIRGKHVLDIVLICIVSEVILISAGVAGFGALIANFPWIETVAKWFGAAFLIFYGLISFRNAFTATDALIAKGKGDQTRWNAILTILALTWLNPHVYLDTVVLLGAIASRYGEMRWHFGFGAMAAAAVFFTSLGFCSTLLQPYFANPKAWRILDFIVGIVMWAIALTLILT